MNYRKDNVPVKRKYSFNWRTGENGCDEKSAKDIQGMRTALLKREQKILSSLTNMDNKKIKENNCPIRKADEDSTYRDILTKINEKPLSGDEDEEDHFQLLVARGIRDV